MNERLLRLAALKGIAPAYRDIWGHEHRASDATLVALLESMGVLDAARDSDAAGIAIDAAIAAHKREQRSRLLPPVRVIFDDERRWALPVVAGGGEAGALDWRIDAEDGSVRQGRLAGTELPALTEPLGYHRLSLSRGGETIASCALIVAPRRCYEPPALQGNGRVWGAAAQLYALRSERNWGIGDYSDLLRTVELWGQHGAGVVGVNPLHAMFPHNPSHASPYSPSSRLFLNVLYLDVEAIEDYADCDAARALVESAEFQARLDALRSTDLVDHAGVAAAKQPVLERLYAHFRREHLARTERSRESGSERARDFDAYRKRRGLPLRQHAMFEALQAHFHRVNEAVWGWPVWPAEYRDPNSPAVARFERERIEAVEWREYLQWQADVQLGAVGQRSLQLGLGVGLYTDLAVSIDRAGAEAWSQQSLYALDASVGAPPDELNLKGQNWGLPPLDPARLRASAYAPFIETLRANMRHAGALRIDHVMALHRLYWIAPGSEATQGAYVHYPFDDLLGIVALESVRNRCAVIGEDLGTVPDEVREHCSRAGVLSYRVLFFERRTGGGADFKAPAEHPRQAVVVASTHDLPTLAGWWEGRDVALRTKLELFPAPRLRERQLGERAQDRARLLLALERERLLPPGLGADPLAVPAMTPALLRAVHRYLARSPAQLLVVQLEDVLLAADQVNLPGTTDQYPNWRRKLELPLERWATDERFVELAHALDSERPRVIEARDARPAASSAAAAVIPRATYRLQLHSDFRFEHAIALVPYLAALGISHLYCSPFLRARPGSRHGYDVVDHNQFNPEIGTREEFEQLVRTLREHGMGLLADVVPNHMGILGGDNAWWLDVLENGQASMHADWFDIDWSSAADPALSARVLLPLLGDHYGVVLERGELRLGFDAETGAFALRYFEHLLPIDPAACAGLLERAMRVVPPNALPPSALGACTSLAAHFARLPPHRRGDAAARAERRRDVPVLKAQLGSLARDHAALAEAIERIVATINGRSGDRPSFEPLDALIDAQPYRLAYWRVAADEINYRRFFDINELAALRMEKLEVFEATHRLVLDLCAGGWVDGLRTDHPDGLADPAGYFRRLQQHYAQRAGLPADAATDGKPLYVVVEKIVASHERQIPPDWPVHGTTGYRFANVLNGLFIDTDAKTRLDRVWRAFVRDEAEDWGELSYRCRHLVLAGAMPGELSVLAAALLRLARADRRTRDFTGNALRTALADVVASFPVYRTYLDEHDKPSPQDRRVIDWAVGRARRRSRGADSTVFDFLRRVLLGKPLPGAPAELSAGYRAFTQRLQQFTAPVAAKGIEDTALYRHHRLISLNDVGGDPDVFGTTVTAFHAASRDRQQHWPHTMLAGSTHDAKRSEDVRARIDVISEMPAAWRLTVRRWSRLNRSRKRTVEGAPAPTRNDEYLLYQTLVGSLPAGELGEAALSDWCARVEQAMLKSAREAKTVTSWISPSPAYETALVEFIRALLVSREGGNLFLDDLLAVGAIFAWYGALNSLSMAALKFTSPGVPDLYQGHELIELSLVDPDNRRPVDYELRRGLLARMGELDADSGSSDAATAVRSMLSRVSDGHAKAWVSWRALQLRKAQQALFRDGDYLPLVVSGAGERHAIAYARRHEGRWVVVAVGRLFASIGLAVGTPPIGETWGETRIELPGDAPLAWSDALTGARRKSSEGSLLLAEVFADAPVAILCGA